MVKLIHKRRPLFLYAIAALIFSVALLFFLSVLYHTGGTYLSPLDDSYIFFQYARQAAAGHLMEYNTGDPGSMGASSPLYVLLLSVVAIFGVNGDGLALAAFLLGIAFFSLSCRLVYQLGEIVCGDVTGARRSTLFFALSGLVAWHYFSGMDTALFASCVLLFAYYYYSEAAGDRVRAFAPLIVLLPLVRPEGLVLIAAYLTSLLLERRLRLLGLRACQAAISGLLFFGLNYGVSGRLTHSSAAPKSIALSGGVGIFDAVYQATVFLAGVVKGLLAGYFGGEQVGAMGGALAWNSVSLYLPPFFLLLCLLGMSGRSGRQRPGLGLFYSLVLIYHLVFLAVFLPLGWHHHRYIFPVLPLLLVFGASGISVIQRSWNKYGTSFGRRLAGFCFIFFVLSMFNFAALYGRNAFLYYREHYRVSEFIKENISPDVPICAADVGILKYRTQNHLTDLKGIISPWVLVTAKDGNGIFSALSTMPAGQRPVYAVLQDRADSPMGAMAGRLREHKLLPPLGSSSEMKIFEIIY